MFEEKINDNDVTIKKAMQRIVLKVKSQLERETLPVLKVMTIWVVDLVNATAAKTEYGHCNGMRRCWVHNQLAAEIVEYFNGRVVKYIGDAVLASFESSYDAVMAAVNFRQTLERLDLPGVEFEIPIETRITLTTGTVEEITTSSGYDIGGQVVDKAARLQELAARGQILVESGVIEHIRLILSEKMPHIKIPQSIDACELHLKGLKEPVKVFEITTHDKPFGYPPSERGQYILKITQAIDTSNSRAWLLVRSMKSRKNRRDIGTLQDKLSESHNKRNVDVRVISYLWSIESLNAAAELDNRGVKVRFCEGQVDVSASLLDKDQVIFSFKKEDGYFTRNKYLAMKSYQVNEIMADDFTKRWQEAIPARLQLAEILNKTFKNCNGTIDKNVLLDHIHQRFGIREDRFLDGTIQLLGFMRKVRYIFVLGRPGTGKTCIRERLQKCLETKWKPA